MTLNGRIPEEEGSILTLVSSACRTGQARMSDTMWPCSGRSASDPLAKWPHMAERP